VPTADLSTTLGLSIGVLVLCLIYSVKIKGMGGWAHELVTAPFGTSKNPVFAVILGVVNLPCKSLNTLPRRFRTVCDCSATCTLVSWCSC
jgi:F0F1-type ATP synthase membrane subunit a